MLTGTLNMEAIRAVIPLKNIIPFILKVPVLHLTRNTPPAMLTKEAEIHISIIVCCNVL